MNSLFSTFEYSTKFYICIFLALKTHYQEIIGKYVHKKVYVLCFK